MALQINTSDTSRTALLAAGSAIGTAAHDNTHRGLAGNVAVGDYIPGYERKEFWQASMSAVHFIDRVMGASRLALIGEVGANYISGMKTGGGVTKFGRDSLFGQSPDADGNCSSQNAANSYSSSWCEDDGFYTDF